MRTKGKQYIAIGGNYLLTTIHGKTRPWYFNLTSGRLHALYANYENRDQHNRPQISLALLERKDMLHIAKLSADHMQAFPRLVALHLHTQQGRPLGTAGITQTSLHTAAEPLRARASTALAVA
jgi:hypothetical protein